MKLSYEADGSLAAESRERLKSEFFYQIEQENVNSIVELPDDLRAIAERHADVWNEAYGEVAAFVLRLIQPSGKHH
ncbi:hypothetical protein HFO56_23270 [Rhizobium laguerreae]|uniref:hypothetical protein n=1 Tax=Rhizobium laguerreae TaxID=1076926 RepID=UPI001C91388C|nr:hypothetical protein [Rhizobium laguerreae]MBY3155247.1 hypothetical protein [Rhizobium laguerreae]